MSEFLRCRDCKHDKGKCVGSSRRVGHKNCFEPREMPNADRIRAMSDEDLAELLITSDFCGECEYCDKVWGCRYYEAHPDGVLNDGCKQAAINWLGQPAEEGTR